MDTKIYHLFTAGAGAFNLFSNQMESLTNGFGPINLVTGILNMNTQGKTILVYSPDPKGKEGWIFTDVKGVNQDEKFNAFEL